MMSTELNSPCRQFGWGDRSKFSLQVELVPDPEPGGVTLEEQFSWGRFQVWAGGRNLCAHYVDGVLYEHVTWYLLPLFEWLATEWDYLLHEQRFPYRNTPGSSGEALRNLNSPETFERSDGWDSDAASCVENWARRHSLQMHREGGLFPDVWVRRFGEMIEISWTADAPAGAPDGFQFANGDGGVLLSPADFAKPLYSVLREASTTLRKAMPDEKRTRELEQAVRRLVRKDRRPLRVGILAGLGQDPAKWREQWGDLLRTLRARHRDKAGLIRDLFMPSRAPDLFVGGECTGALMFGAVSPTIDTSDAVALAELLLTHASAGKRKKTKQDGLLAYARPEPLKAGIEPWRQGYALAQEWAETAEISKDGEPVDIEAHLSRYGVEVTDIRLTDVSIGAVAIAHASKRPLVAVNTDNFRNKYPTGRKFTLAHELCHLLHDRRQGVELAFISGAWAPVGIEQRANAFAAALLMPDTLLSRAAADSNVDVANLTHADLLALAKRLDVSLDALGHHLVNRRWIDEAHRVELMMEQEEQTVGTTVLQRSRKKPAKTIQEVRVSTR